MSTPFKTKDVLSHFPNDSLPIVSVGCGMCKRELEMSKTRTIICVDPTQANIDQWTDIKRAMKPDFDNVKQLVQAKPTIIGNCHLLIEYSMTDYVTYDFLAIYDLQPKSLVLLTTSTAHSGGLMLHMWLNNNGIKTTNKATTIKSIKETHGADAMLSPNALKYNLHLIRKKLRILKNKPKDLDHYIYILVSGTRKDNKIIKRPLLSPAHMEHMGRDNVSQTTPMKSLANIVLINRLSGQDIKL